VKLDDYRCPQDVYILLQKWGRSQNHGMPRLSYPRKSTGVGDYVSNNSRDDTPLPSLDEFYTLCWIIDHLLNRPKVEALKCKFRYHVRGRPMNKRQSAEKMAINLDEYDRLLRSALRSVDIRMGADDTEIV
jgi:hypothetical protein